MTGIKLKPYAVIMEKITSFFILLEQGVLFSLILLILMGVMFFKLNGVSKDISQINAKLDNHIGDTNKKIERLSDRFDRLYETLLNKQVNKQDKKTL